MSPQRDCRGIRQTLLSHAVSEHDVITVPSANEHQVRFGPSRCFLYALRKAFEDMSQGDQCVEWYFHGCRLLAHFLWDGRALLFEPAAEEVPFCR